MIERITTYRDGGTLSIHVKRLYITETLDGKLIEHANFTGEVCMDRRMQHRDTHGTFWYGHPDTGGQIENPVVLKHIETELRHLLGVMVHNVGTLRPALDNLI